MRKRPTVNPTHRRRDQDGHGFSWKGGRMVDKQGYVRLRMPDHPHADPKGYVKEHLVVVCRVLGRKLPAKAEVHHVDEDKTRNVGGNLVLCPDRAYHMLLHQRARAYDACGNASWRICTFCSVYGAPRTLRCKKKQAWHPDCRRKYQRDRWKITGPGPVPQKTHCLRGHPLSGENLVKGDLARGTRSCRICRNAQQYARSHPGEVKGAVWAARDQAILEAAQRVEEAS